MVQVTIAAAMRWACKAGYSFKNQALRSKPFAYKEGDVLPVLLAGCGSDHLWLDLDDLARLPRVGSRLNPWGGDVGASFSLFL
jgi:hypothetical protein